VKVKATFQLEGDQEDRQAIEEPMMFNKCVMSIVVQCVERKQKQFLELGRGKKKII